MKRKASCTKNMHAARIIVFTRFPVPGRAKTRLIPALGSQGAADLQRQMTEFTVAQVRRTGIPMQIRFTGGSEEQMRRWLGADEDCRQQGEPYYYTWSSLMSLLSEAVND